MRKWPLLFACISIVVIGCAGNNASNNGATGGGGASTSSGATGSTPSTGVYIPPIPGTIDNYWENGQGRQNTTYTADIGIVEFTDTVGHPTLTENPEPSDIFLPLNGYNPQNRIITAHVPYPGSSGSPNSRIFTNLTFFINSFFINGIQQSGGVAHVITPTLNVQPIPAPPAQSNESIWQMPVNNVTAFPGRFTAVQIYFNDGMFDFNNIPPTLTQDVNGNYIFQVDNGYPNEIPGFLSDYVSFDVSHVPNISSMTMTSQEWAGQPVDRIFVSGDNFAVGGPTPPNSSTSEPFEVLTTIGAQGGTYKNTDPQVDVAPYDLTEPNPIFGFGTLGYITSLEGAWYDAFTKTPLNTSGSLFNPYITASDSTLMISFPGQGDTATQQCVIVVRSGGVVSNMYFGNVNFNNGGKAVFHVFPITQLENGLGGNELTGTLAQFTDSNGNAVPQSGSWWQSVRNATFTITTPGSPITPTGKLVVFRY